MKVDIQKNFDESNNPYNWRQGCEFCKKSFAKGEKFIRVDVHITDMRGDDDVWCYHNGCFHDGFNELQKKHNNKLKS